MNIAQLLSRTGRGLNAAATGYVKGLPLREQIARRHSLEAERSRQVAAQEEAQKRAEAKLRLDMALKTGDRNAITSAYYEFFPDESQDFGPPQISDKGDKPVLPALRQAEEALEAPEVAPEAPEEPQKGPKPEEGNIRTAGAPALLAGILRASRPKPEEPEVPDYNWRGGTSPNQKFIIGDDPTTGLPTQYPNPGYEPKATETEQWPKVEDSAITNGADYSYFTRTTIQQDGTKTEERIPIFPGESEIAFQRQKAAERVNQLSEEWGARIAAKKDYYDYTSSIRQNEKVTELMSTSAAVAVEKVQEGLPADQALDGIVATLTPWIGREEAEDHARSMEDLVQHYELQIDWNAKERGEMIESNNAMAQADRALALMNDPVVRSELGSASFRFERLDEILSGGEGLYSAPTRKFITHLKHLRDALTRSRTGAALNMSEEAFYEGLIGSGYTSPDVLRERLETYSEYEQQALDSMWDTALRIKWSGNDKKYQEALDKYYSREARTADERRKMGNAPDILEPEGWTDEDME